MSESDRRRPSSFIEDEEIEIKPSTELIPDEYERKNNTNILVELIRRQIDGDADDLAKQLTNLGFSITTTIIDRLNNTNEWVINFATEVNEKTQRNAYDGLLMIFAKVPLSNGVLKEIWGKFTSTKCPALKNKPKIFIFQVLKTGLQADGRKLSLQTDIKTAYDTPSEADILIIYDKFLRDSQNNFFDYFQECIKTYGHQEDIVNLVSLSIGSETRPLVISTMTRKFFFTLSQSRGHHHNINESHTEIKENLEKVINFVKNIPDTKPKDKNKGIKSSFSFRNTFGFRNKNQHGKESKNGDNKVQESEEPGNLNEVKEAKAIKEENSVKGKIKPLNKSSVDSLMSPPNKSPTIGTSIPTSIPSTPTRKTRFPSNSFSSKEDLSKKPPWK